MFNLIDRLVKEEEGQGLVEYALILGLIAIVAITVIVTIGEEVEEVFDEIGKKLASAG